MNNIAGWFGTIGMAAGIAVCPQESVAEGFSGKEFLAWSENGQNNYIGTSVTMATMVASRVNPEVSNCLDTWYAANEDTAQQRNDEIRATIARNAEYHPSAVILLVMEGACGAFGGD